MQQESAYRDSQKIMCIGFVCSVILSFGVVVFNRYYVLIFQVEEEVRQMTIYILFAYAVVASLKVQNMIVGGILRSGGRTAYVMAIDFIGTWVFGVPLGLLAAFVFRLPIAAVYFILSMKEGIRVIISGIAFVKKKRMRRL